MFRLLTSQFKGIKTSKKFTIMKDLSHSFPPIIGDNPTVLILGTLPSKVSLERQQYYGHPQNKFWRIIYALYGGSYEDSYEARVSFAKEYHIAVWDVCFTAVRPGSLDADISEEQPNRIEEFLVQYPSITTIVFNGKKAKQLFFKYFKEKESIKYLTLLSTSPANAAFSFEQKIEDWRQIV